MMRVGNLAVLATTVFFVGFGSAAHAADENRKSRVQLTLFGGYQLGNSFDETTAVTATDGSTENVTTNAAIKDGASYGVALNWESEPDSIYEIAYSRQSSSIGAAAAPIDLKMEYLQFGGYTTLGNSDSRSIPYVLITIGAARFSPDSPDLNALTKPSMAIGGGALFPLTSHISLRLDARVYATFFNNQSDLFCQTRNGASCIVHLKGDALLQPNISLGFTYGF
jgi:hypothetical protein